MHSYSMYMYIAHAQTIIRMTLIANQYSQIVIFRNIENLTGWKELLL